MNKAYRLIWSTRLSGLVVAAETARGRGKAACRAAVPAMLLSAVALTAQALPDGSKIQPDAGNITTVGNTLTVNQKDQKMVIEWNRFSTSRDESVVFNQPNSQSIVLNRVIGNESSTLLGSLTANGQVWLLNPNGIVIGQGATVNVGGLLASSLYISDGDFMSGKYNFSGKGGSVTNSGAITVGNITVGTIREKGYVAMMGGAVSNEGIITARLGTVALAGGSQVTLDFNGDKLLTVGAGAVDALAQNKGSISASGGNVILTAQGVNALLKTVVNNEGTIEAQTLGGAKGRMVLNGGTGGGTVSVAGTLDASGGSGTTVSDGGTIVLAGTQVKIVDNAIITAAGTAGGKAGQLEIAASGFTVADSVTTVASGMSAATLKNQLALNNVRIKTAAFDTRDTGDIDIDAALDWATNNTLTVDAHRHVNVNAAITFASTPASTIAALSLKAAQNIQINAPVSAGSATASLTLTPGSNAGNDYYLNNGAKINLKTGARLVIAGEAYTIINTIAELQAMKDKLDGHYALGSDVDAAGTAFTPVGGAAVSFSGVLDGMGHEVKGLTIIKPDQFYTGLIGYNAGSIQNLGLVNVNVIGGLGTGALVGRNTNSIRNVSVTGVVTGTASDTGGLVGIHGGTIHNASFSGGVIGSLAFTGGLVGHSSGNISHASASGAVTGIGQYTGGLVGYNNSGNISHASATTSVNAKEYTGGLVGYNFRGSISNASAIAGVTAKDYTGGLVGYNNRGSILNASATGAVTGQKFTGGLVGAAEGQIGQSRIEFVVRTGSVKGTEAASTGALIGKNLGDAPTYINNAYASGTVNEVELMQTLDSTLLLIGSTNINDVAGYDQVRALDANDIKKQEIFKNFDFTNTWRIYEDKTTPLLKAFLKPVTVSAHNASKTYDGNAYTDPITGIHYSVAGVNLDGNLVYGNPLAPPPVDASTYGLGGLWSTAYDISYGRGALTINPKTLMLSVTPSFSKPYNGKTDALVSLAAQALITGVGSQSITVGAGDYSGAFNSKNVIEAQTVTVAPVSPDYNGYAIKPGADTNLANYTLQVKGEITPATLRAVVSKESKEYDGNFYSGGTIVYEGFVNGETVATAPVTGTVTYGGDAQNQKNAGTYSITVDTARLSAANYEVKPTDNTSTATVAPIATGTSIATSLLTIKPKQLTAAFASPLSKVYDGTRGATLYLVDPATLSGFVTGESFKVTNINNAVAGTYDTKDAGTGKSVTVALNADNFTLNDGTAFGNYRLETVGDITPKTATVTATNFSKTYDGKTFNGKDYNDGGGIQYTNFVNSDLDAVRAVTLGYGEAQGKKDAGQYAITPQGTFSDNYAVTFNSGRLTITQKELTARFSSIPTKEYDGIVEATLDFDKATLTDFVAGESFTVLNPMVTGSYNSKDVSQAKEVTVALSAENFIGVNGALLSNYRLKAVPAKITLAELTVTAKDYSKSYDGVAYNGGGEIEYSGFKNKETQDVLGGKLGYGAAQGKTGVGDYTITPSGLSSTNYALTFNPGTLTITPRELSVTFKSMPTKIYDGTPDAMLYFDPTTLGNFADREFITARSDTVTALYDSKNVGNGKTVTVDLNPDHFDAGPGTNLANYQLKTMQASITPAPLMVRANDAWKKYDGKAYSGGNGLTYRGFVGGETSAVMTGTLRYSGAAQGAALPGSYAIVPEGLMAANYKVGFVPGKLVVDPYIFNTKMIGAAPQALVGQRLPPKFRDDRARLADAGQPAFASECTKLVEHRGAMQCASSRK